MDSFEGRVAVVTGAGSGIGLAIAQRFAAEGMHVVLSDIDQVAVEQAAAVLRAAGHEARGVRTDASRLDDVEGLAEEAVKTFGKVHVICNNAGVDGYRGGDIWEAETADWAWTMGVNFYGAVYGVRTFVPLLLAHGEEGHIVNTASLAALAKPFSMYGISKHALLALSEVLDVQLKKRNAPIGVTALFPGTTATGLFDRRLEADSADENETARAYREASHVRLSMGVSPDVVADKLIAGMRVNALYVRTSAAYNDAMGERHLEMLSHDA